MIPESRLRMAEVPAHIKERTGVNRSRATVYSWIRKGTNIEGQVFKLQTELIAGQLFTRKEWVDIFLSRLNQSR